MEEPGRFHDATLVRIRQPDRPGGAALPVADEKGRDRLLRRACERGLLLSAHKVWAIRLQTIVRVGEDPFNGETL